MVVERPEVQDGYDSRMLDSRYRLCFGEEPNECVGILAELTPQELHSNGTGESVIVREPNLGHASAAEKLTQLVSIFYNDPVSHYIGFFP
jgi:hypothetical protein